jgi:ATP-binding cassette subfamily B protein
MNNSKSFLVQAFKTTFKANYTYGLLVIVTVAAGALISTWPSLVLRTIIDGSLLTGGGGLWQLALMFLGAVLLIGLNDLAREYGAMVFGQMMLLNIRNRMLDYLRDLPMKYYNNTPAGETMSRFTADIDAINSLFSAGLVTAIADLFKIIGFLAALFMLSRPLGVVALCALPVLYLATDYFRRNIYQKQLAVRRKVSDINTSIHEIYSGIKVIKVYGRERYFAERFEPTLESHRLAMNANSVYDAWFPCVTQTIRAVVIATALFIGASNNFTFLSLGLSLGTLAAAADLLIRLFEPIEAISGEIQTVQQAMAGISRVEAFFGQETEENSGPHDTSVPFEDVDVVIEDVYFSYGGEDVLREANMTLSAGTKAAIAGRTGSGKTTLMNLVAGLYPVRSGRILVGGHDPHILPPDQRRRLVGIVPQTVHIFNASVYENVTLRDDRISRAKVQEALETVGLWPTVQHLPQGVDTQLGEGAQQLSQGQTQLLSLARAIVTNPPLLLLDELTSGLDALTEKQVLAAIRGISGKRTILTISHRLSGIIDADVVHIMEGGKIVESGRPRALAQREGWYSIYKRLEDRGWRIS